MEQPREEKPSSGPTQQVPAKRVAQEDPIEARVSLIQGIYSEPLDTSHAITDVHMAAIRYAKDLQQIFKRGKVDTGRAIASLDLVRQSYSTATDALLLPYVTKKSE
jgi:hypothetical protein